ncbi:hypothetical protein [uncultured Sphingomonas sp.]|uniref:hypothetical protein n=1 Tax=uncultured Sphingomonas sp. TaxID=158754 RepID=UPI0025D3B9FE|nr:hypothetical protein [uncultured Sphingomonas sp.]
MAARRVAAKEQTEREQVAREVVQSYRINDVTAFGGLDDREGSAELFGEVHALLVALESSLDQDHGPLNNALTVQAMRGLARLTALGAMLGRLAA